MFVCGKGLYVQQLIVVDSNKLLKRGRGYQLDPHTLTSSNAAINRIRFGGEIHRRIHTYVPGSLYLYVAPNIYIPKYTPASTPYHG